jgi:cell division protein ZipA
VFRGWLPLMWMKRYVLRPCKMWELRLILALIGVVFIAGVYLLSRQRKSRPKEFGRNTPTITDSSLPEVPSDLVAGSVSVKHPHLDTEAVRITAKADNVHPESEPDQLILALHVVSREQDGFAGSDVLVALESTDLHYGEYRAFHRLTNNDMRESIFSVANMVEPGVLDPEVLPGMRIPGLTLFLLLPGPQNGVAACAEMLATARSLARQLNGEVLDNTRSTLTTQSAQAIRERILEFQGRMRGPRA